MQSGVLLVKGQAEPCNTVPERRMHIGAQWIVQHSEDRRSITLHHVQIKRWPRVFASRFWVKRRLEGDLLLEHADPKASEPPVPSPQHALKMK